MTRTNTEASTHDGGRQPSARTGRVASGARRASAGALAAVRGAVAVATLVPGTVRATGHGAHETTSAMQTLPDSTLRGLAATSVGLGAGFYLASAPRLMIAAGLAPAVLAVAAIVLRPLDRFSRPRLSAAAH